MELENRRHSTLSKLDKEKLGAAQLKQVIRDLGLKVTHQRLVILEKLLRGRDHITAQEVFESVAETDSDIGFATVYRFLRALTDHGFVTEVRMKGLPARYEWAGKKHHDHLTCTDCGSIQEFESEDIERLQEAVATKLGFILTDHLLELYGVCSNCQRVRAKSGSPLLPGQRHQ